MNASRIVQTFTIILSVGILAGMAAGQGHGRGGRMGGGKPALMQDARGLVFNSEHITRTIEEIPGGVRTTTTTDDPEVLKMLRRHPRDMSAHYKEGGMVRGWDPLFVELVGVQHLVTMEFENVKNGILVTSTSEDAEVVKLIRAHAYKVSEFVERGMEAMHEPTPLPADYDRAKVGASQEEVAKAPVIEDPNLVRSAAGHSKHAVATTGTSAASSCCSGSQCKKPATDD